jgi:hypothetical protein
MFVDFLVIAAPFDATMCRSSVVNEQYFFANESFEVHPSEGRKKPLGSGVSLRSFHWLLTPFPYADSEQHR